MKRSTLVLAAALGCALLFDVVFYAAYLDAIRYAGSLAGKLANAQHRQLRPPPYLFDMKPPPSLFDRLVEPAPIEESFATEVSGG